MIAGNHELPVIDNYFIDSIDYYFMQLYAAFCSPSTLKEHSLHTLEPPLCSPRGPDPA